MRMRLLRRRLTIRPPRVMVRSALPWPLRWLVLAVVLGFCCAVGLWAFDFGRSIAGLDSGARAELVRLRAEVASLREATQSQQNLVNTSDSLLKAERSAMEGVVAQLRQVEADNRRLREDLGFFERLMPSNPNEGLSIRGLQVEMLTGTQLRWQMLALQAMRNPSEFNGRLELSFAGTRDGKPWTLQHPAQGQPLQFVQYRRMEGLIDLPPNTVVKTVTARLMAGQVVRATRTIQVE